MNSKNIVYQKSEGIATIKLNRPEKLNALSLNLFAELATALDDAEADEGVRVVIITGEGRAFCAGDDIDDMVRSSHSLSASLAVAKQCHEGFMRIEKLSKPVIAAVNGLAYGGGCELAVAADIIVASDEARLALPEGRIGAFAGFSARRLNQIVGRKKAMEILLTGDPMSAHEAWRIGLVNKVVPAAELQTEAINMAKRVMTVTPMAATVTKGMVVKRFAGEESEETRLRAMLIFSTRGQDADMKDSFMKKLKG